MSYAPLRNRPSDVSCFVPQRRVVALAAVFALAFLAVLARLAFLQLYEGRRYQGFLERHIARERQVPPRRGRIVDSRGEILAEDRPVNELWLKPAESGRQGRRRVTVSLLPPLTADELLRLGRSRAGQRNFHLDNAVARLAAENPLVARLADILAAKPGAFSTARLAGAATGAAGIAEPAPPSAAERLRAVLARDLLAAFLARDAAEPGEITLERPWLSDVDAATFYEILRRADDPDEDAAFRALKERVTSKRIYPHGAAVAHLVGYCSRLDRGEYVRLRGRWREGADEPEPGAGFLTMRGRTLFSVLPGASEDGNPEAARSGLDGASREKTDEERILALRTRRQNGRLERVQDYLLDERVGRAGVEAYYNQRLRGRHILQPWRLAKPDPDGPARWMPLGERLPPRDGEDIALTIDLKLQRRVRDELLAVVARLSAMPENDGFPIAANAVLMDPHNGEIFSMVSVPDYDPERLSDDWAALNADRAKPMLYHAIAEQFQPGSVLKPFVGLAALEEGLVGAYDTVTCRGKVVIGGERFQCMEQRVHGEIDLEHALMYSCNMVFYELGHRLRARRLTEWLRRFGFGRRTGVDIAGETPGLLPLREVARRGGLPTGQVFLLSTGQGSIAATPIQLAVAYAALANADATGAKIVRPHVLKPGPESPAGDWRLKNPKEEFAVSRADLEAVRRGLWLVVQGEGDRRGTGALSRMPVLADGHPILEIAGKTGSAVIDAYYGGALYKKQVSHAWYCGYAPADDPEVVVVVLVEYGDLGGVVSAPLAKKLLQIYFDLEDVVDEPAADGLG